MQKAPGGVAGIFLTIAEEAERMETMVKTTFNNKIMGVIAAISLILTSHAYAWSSFSYCMYNPGPKPERDSFGNIRGRDVARLTHKSNIAHDLETEAEAIRVARTTVEIIPGDTNGDLVGGTIFQYRGGSPVDRYNDLNQRAPYTLENAGSFFQTWADIGCSENAVNVDFTFHNTCYGWARLAIGPPFDLDERSMLEHRRADEIDPDIYFFLATDDDPLIAANRAVEKCNAVYGEDVCFGEFGRIDYIEQNYAARQADDDAKSRSRYNREGGSFVNQFCDGTAAPINQAAVQEDCDGTNTPILDDGECRAREDGDCTGETPILVDGECQARMDDDETTEPPNFTIVGGGDTDLTTTESDRHVVAFEDVSATQITVATTVAGFNYTQTAESSSELTVGLTDGVVRFIPETVSAGDYQIFVVADNNTVTATIPLYLTVAAATDNNGGETVNNGGGGGSSGGAIAGIVGGVVVVGLALWYFTSDSDDLEWTPSYAYSGTNDNISYSVGSRWTATANDWQLYWQTRQNNDRLVYGSGLRYNGDIFSAAMNSQSQDKQTAIDLHLAANQTIGNWTLGGGYDFGMQLLDTDTDTETDTQNRLNAKVRYTVDKWILSANANTNGDRSTARFAARYTVDKWILSANANTNGDTGTARINYSYRF